MVQLVLQQKNEIFKIVSLEEFLEFYVDKDASKKSLRFQLTNINGDIPNLKDSKIYNFPLTKIREKRKRKMAEPIETVIIRVQQNFEIVGGLNSVQIKTEDDRVLNILKKHENSHKLTLLGMLFPAPISNDTEQFFQPAES